MSFKGEKNNIKIYDDYAHHPTEIRAVISAFKERYPSRPLKVLFQPHRYSRTQLCWDDFLVCFSEADALLLTDIYAAGEKQIAGLSGESFFNAVRHKNKKYVSASDVDSIQQELSDGDVFVTLGAGNLWQTGEAILNR